LSFFPPLPQGGPKDVPNLIPVPVDTLRHGGRTIKVLKEANYLIIISEGVHKTHVPTSGQGGRREELERRQHAKDSAQCCCLRTEAGATSQGKLWPLEGGKGQGRDLTLEPVGGTLTS
jgi:hypothetical protein